MSTLTTSISVVIDSKINAQGLSKIYVRVIQARKKKDLFIGVRWPRELYDKANEQLLPRFPNDPDVEKYNNLIIETKNRINKLSVESYCKNVHYTIDDYISVIQQKSSLIDFAIFFQEAAAREYQMKVMSIETYQKHISILRKIKTFFGERIPMAVLQLDKIKEFDAYWRSTHRKPNTIASYHKVLAKYIGIAVEKGLIEKNPYDKYKFSFTPGERVALTQDEVKKLYQVFEEQTLDHVEHEVLRRFLFSCITGIRISDTHQVTADHIKDNILSIIPHKTRKLGKKINIPLPIAAIKLIYGRKGKLFVPFADPSINRILKRIAAKADVNPRLSYHSARDTFGTIFIELGGDIKSLCDLMGHSSTRITEIYLKMADKRKVHLMNNFDNMFQ